VQQKLVDIKALERRIKELEELDPRTLTKRWDAKVQVLETAIDETLSDIFGKDTDEYERYRSAAGLDHGGISMVIDGYHHDEAAEARKYVSEGKDSSLHYLKQAIKRLNEEIEDAQHRGASVTHSGATHSTTPAVRSEPSRRVFVVHGRDGEMRESVARFISHIGFEPIILHDEANSGRTVIEKFEAHSEPAGFAIVLLSGDDEGRLKGTGDFKLRARQNVILELGYFVAKLHRSHVCALKRGDLELPSDIVGVVFESYDDAGAWKQVIGREMEAAGYDIDWHRIMSRR
jgi:predicted nucleotide-binding protein